jgi:hypothetical protein
MREKKKAQTNSKLRNKKQQNERKTKKEKK